MTSALIPPTLTPIVPIVHRRGTEAEARGLRHPALNQPCRLLLSPCHPKFQITSIPPYSVSLKFLVRETIRSTTLSLLLLVLTLLSYCCKQNKAFGPPHNHNSKLTTVLMTTDSNVNPQQQ